jgi:hypothetical protein
LTAANLLQAAEIGQIFEIWVRCLNFEKSGDFLKGGKNIQSIRMHSRVTRTEREIRINLLETDKRMINDR